MKSEYYNNSCISYPWWLIAGPAITGNILIIGEMNEGDLCLLRAISNSITCLDLTDSLDLISSNRFDLIYLVTGPQTSLALNNSLSIILISALSNTGLLVVYGQKMKSTILQSLERFSLPCIAYSDLPSEAYSKGSYTSNKNQCLLKEKLKNIILNTSLHKIFIKNYLQIYSPETNPVTLISELNRIIQNEVPSCTSDKAIPILSKIYFKYGKLIITYTGNKHTDDIVIVLPTDRSALIQRTNEKITLDSLRKINTINNLLVSFYIETEVVGFRACIMENTHGNTVDEPCKNIDIMIKKAFLCILNLSNATKIGNHTAITLSTKIQTYIDKFNLKMHKFNIVIRQNSLIISNELSGIPVICMHGDLKLENFVIDYKNDVNKIIDWELSELDGLPLLDLFYFIAYNDHIINKTGLNEAIYNLALYENNPEHTLMLKTYSEKNNINTDQIKLLYAVFFIHHFAFRIELDNISEYDMSSLKSNFDTNVASVLGID